MTEKLIFFSVVELVGKISDNFPAEKISDYICHVLKIAKIN
ncbi:hypothetical protein [Okeania sp. SIO2B3]|nr:hypothetical protein [Okeania sp. SIO2B3]